MRLISIIKSLVAGNVAIISASATPVSGIPLTLVGGGTVTLDTARRVLLTYGNEGSARTLVLIGTNGAGAPITETLAVPSGAGGTVASVQDFLTIARALPLGGGWTAAASLGTNSVGSTQWFVPSQHITPFVLTIGTRLVSGTANWSVEISNADVKAPIPLWGSTQQPAPVPNPVVAMGLSGLTADAQVTITDVIQGFRLVINSGTGVVAMNATQAGMRQG